MKVDPQDGTRETTGTVWAVSPHAYHQRNPCLVTPLSSPTHPSTHTHQSPLSEDQAVHPHAETDGQHPQPIIHPLIRQANDIMAQQAVWSRQFVLASGGSSSGTPQVAAMRISLTASRPAD